jgi:hypothetical protein
MTQKTLEYIKALELYVGALQTQVNASNQMGYTKGAAVKTLLPFQGALATAHNAYKAEQEEQALEGDKGL